MHPYYDLLRLLETIITNSTDIVKRLLKKEERRSDYIKMTIARDKIPVYLFTFRFAQRPQFSYIGIVLSHLIWNGTLVNYLSNTYSCICQSSWPHAQLVNLLSNLELY